MRLYIRNLYAQEESAAFFLEFGHSKEGIQAAALRVA
jgi:hypothetical protein